MSQRFAWLYIIYPMSILLYLFSWLPSLSWGTIDDAYHWELAHRAMSLIQNFLALIREDISQGGMFRPVYTVYELIVYNLFESHPEFIYAINWIALGLSSFCIVRFWARIGNLDKSSRKPKNPTLAFLAAALFCFEPWTKLLVHISLQEKLGLVFLPFALWQVLKTMLQNRLRVRDCLGFAFWLGVVLFSKATFISYVPTLLIIVILIHPVAKKKIWPLISILLIEGLVAGLLFLSIRGGYSSGYSFSLGNISQNVIKAHPLTWLLWVLSLGAITRFIFMRLKGRKPSSPENLWFVGSVGVLASSIVIAPWSTSDYYLSILGPWILALLCALAIDLPNMFEYPAAPVVLGLIMFCGSVANLKPQLGRNAEMKQLTKILREIRTQTSWTRAYFDSCNESRDSLDLFSRPNLFPYNPNEEPHYFIRSVNHWTPAQGKSDQNILWIEAQGCLSPLSEKIVDRIVLFSGQHWTLFAPKL